ncbi:MAG TPA: C4-type zinc ribbon domain-containing protein, partial [Candidatus Eisenbacteria bacterium]|nr:C4-type zinc ribbon domain-containing protein [Candidatus Eisenbacteria bacterium]
VVLEHFEREEALVAQAKQAEQRIAEEERKLKAGEAELEKEGASLDQSIHSLKVDRDQVRPRVTPTLLARYDRLAGTRNGIAVAEVRKGACGACFKALTPQMMQEARRTDVVLHCESCGRILIWAEESLA